MNITKSTLLGPGLAVLLSACGGGGGTSLPGEPVLTLLPAGIKTFQFSWEDVNGETDYRLLEDPDGISGYTEVAAIAADAEGHNHVVFLPGRINARYILQACNARGCSDSAPVNVSGTLVGSIGYLKASNAGSGDSFGFSVSLSGDGDTLAVGARQEDSGTTGINGPQNNDNAPSSGAVYVFNHNNGQWSQQAYIKASNTGVLDFFGHSTALSGDGDTLAVGAMLEGSSATGIDGPQNNNTALNSGAVYVFTRSDGVWSQQAYVKASNTGAGDRFGTSVALSGDGDTLAVGAEREGSDATGIGGDEANDNAAESGAVYVYTRDDGTWAQQAYVKASNTGAGDHFGTSVTLSGDGDTLAVGADSEDSSATGIDGDEVNDNAVDSGAVYVFTRSDGAWAQQAFVKASNTGTGDRFGASVALSGDGDTLAVGASQENSGATRVNGPQGNDNALNSGAVYVFSRSDGSWAQQAYVKASNTDVNDRFGTSVALSGDGDILAVGALFEDSNATGIGGVENNNDISNSGAAYVYARSAGEWRHRAYVKASNTRASAFFGYSVALSGDGATLAVGAYGEDSDTSGIDGDQASDGASSSGAAYLY